MYVTEKPEVLFAGKRPLLVGPQGTAPVMAGLDRSDYVSLGYLDKSDYVSLMGLGQSVRDIPQPAFLGKRPYKIKWNRGVPVLGQLGQAGEGTALAIGIGGLVISALVSFGMMTLASYVGSRWAMKRA